MITINESNRRTELLESLTFWLDDNLNSIQLAKIVPIIKLKFIIKKITK
ncbi:hypothetical protein ES703_81067 [subsurface metagenome]